ncbi:hypothetical protein [Novosphingobium sp. SG707]|uniref:hypothetical protein n=1 Tax=Novosphingobium sp. SG707 TaxID=2586996 RepID=UPI001446937F|nr:hypothetical protein [Novosphingobium sp. SG707]NKI99577.1 hypothetical protein [Novosphingobium sp. SG707]
MPVIDYTAPARPVVLNMGEGTVAALTAAAQAKTYALQSRAAYRIVADNTERAAIPAEERTYGLHVYVVDQARIYVWTQNGVAGADGWVGRTNQADFNAIITAHDANFAHLQDEIDTLNGTVSDLSSRISALEALRLLALSATALSTATHPPVALRWMLEGALVDYQTIEWGGWKFQVDGGARELTVADWSAPPAAMVMGDSISDPNGYGTWPTTLAAALGLTLYAPARYNAGPRQAYRSGALPLYLTVAGNHLPAGGTSVSVTAINGAATATSDMTDAYLYPFGFLNTYSGDTFTTGTSMTGTYGGRRVTVSIPNGGSSAYSVVQDAGLDAVDIPAQSLFVPDFAAWLDRAELWIMMSNNYYYSGVAGDHINPRVYDDIAAIISRARGQRIMLFGITGGPDSGAGTTVGTALRAFNDGLAARWPQYYVRDASGRDTLARLLAGGNGSSGDNADVAAGIIPRSLRIAADDPHLNSAGNAIIATLAQEYRALQTTPPAITLDTAITVTAVSGAQRASYTVKPVRSPTL